MDGQDLDRKDPITTPGAPESDERLLARYGTFSRLGGECRADGDVPAHPIWFR